MQDCYQLLFDLMPDSGLPLLPSIDSRHPPKHKLPLFLRDADTRPRPLTLHIPPLPTNAMLQTLGQFTSPICTQPVRATVGGDFAEKLALTMSPVACTPFPMTMIACVLLPPAIANLIRYSVRPACSPSFPGPRQAQDPATLPGL